MIEVPVHWSAAACEALETRCLIDRIPSRLVPVPEDDAPRWLWRREADRPALAALPERRRMRAESSAKEVFERVAGAWTYRGWKDGYFDAERDARAFFDEIAAMLCRQLCVPDLAGGRTAGLWWAYGIDASPSSGCGAELRTGGVAGIGADHVPPSGAFIHGVSSDLAGEGGVLDLWRREASLLAAGLGSGANLSNAGAEGGGTLLDHLKLGDGAAAMFRDPDRLGPPARTVVVDADHPEAAGFIAWKAGEAQRAAALFTGSAIVQRHIEAVILASRRPGGRTETDPAHNAALRLAIAAARQAMVPDAMVERALALVREGRARAADDIIDPLTEYAAFAAASGQSGWHLLRVRDAMLESAVENEPGQAALLDGTAAAAWTAGASGMLFADAAQAWNTCAASGDIRAVGGDGDFAFLDDSTCGRAVLNAGAFLRGDGFDAAGFAHAVRLMTVALDIGIGTSALPTARLARRLWDFRPLGLGIANLAGALIAQGLAYDSDSGRAFCAAVCALMTGTAYAASAEMAAELGAFPAFAQNREPMLRVAADHRRAAEGATAGYAALGWRPVQFRAADCRDRKLAEAALAAWDDAIARGAAEGFRNAQTTLVPPAEAECALLDCATRGVAPAATLVRYERLPGAGFRKTILPAVIGGLRALGYGETATDLIVRHVAGHRTLAGAPGVNHENLRRHGFNDAAIARVEAALEDAPDIRFAFDRWTLGDGFCIEMLGFAPHMLEDPTFDMLGALGFSEAAIEAANLYCCGADTLEGAPYLDPAHLAVFDCPRPLGERGRRRLSIESRIRMMATIQPFLSGSIGHAVSLPADATVRDMREALLLGWRLGLKAVALERDGAAFGDPFSDTLPATDRETVAELGRHFAVIEGGRAQRRKAAPGASPGRRSVNHARAGVSQALAIARAARSFDGAPAQHPNRQDHLSNSGARESASAEAETSRQRSSHVARGAASVPSSADAAVEQRQV